MGQHKQKQEIAKWQQRKKDIDEAIAKRIVLRVLVDPSGMVASVASSILIPCPEYNDRTDSVPSPVGKCSDDEVVHDPSLDHNSDTDTDTDNNDDVEFSELCCNNPAWVRKYCKSNKKILCQQMFCMFVKNRRKFQWLTEPFPAMPLHHAPE